jgi:predicted RNA binding protein YcfA (HicA-like mRNA interferase family)
MPREKRDVESGLENKGFQKQEGDHRYYVYWSIEGKKSMAKTKTSHGSGRDISDDLLGKMARQCGVTKLSFLKLIDCPLDRPEYESLLKQAGRL